MSRSKHVRSFLVCGAVAFVPALVGAQPLQTLQAPPPRPSTVVKATWERSWDAAWSRATDYYSITAATTLASDPACQGDLGFHPRIKELTQAIADRRYGDATRLIAVVHDKSTCLSLEGTRGLEFALGGFMHRAMTELSGTQAEIAVHGAFNVGSMIFDQLQYTRRSWWLPMMKFHADKLAPIIARYPKSDLGFYAIDWSRNTLSNGVDPMLLAASMRDFANYADGTCSMLEMAGAGYKCKGWVGKNGLSGGGAGGGKGGADGGLPSVPAGDARVSCVASAAQSTGARGKLGCAAKAVAGMTFDPRTSPRELLDKGLAGGSPGIRDPRCALSKDAGNTGAQADDKAIKKEPTTWDKVVDGAKAAASVAIDVVVSVFDKTPPVVSDLKPLASAEGADAVRGGLQMVQEISTRDKLLSDDVSGYYQAREKRVTTDPQANKRTVDGLNGPLGGGSTGGSCGRGSNVARRAQALYDCITGDSPKPTSRGPNNPLVSRFDPDQVQTSATGAMACAMNGGDMPRNGFNDPKCKAARCVQGATSCPCDAPGGRSSLGGSTVTPKLSATTSPNCAEPPCGATLPTPQGTGGPKAPPGPPGGGGPAPAPPPRR